MTFFGVLSLVAPKMNPFAKVLRLSLITTYALPTIAGTLLYCHHILVSTRSTNTNCDERGWIIEAYSIYVSSNCCKLLESPILIVFACLGLDKFTASSNWFHYWTTTSWNLWTSAPSAHVSDMTIYYQARSHLWARRGAAVTKSGRSSIAEANHLKTFQNCFLRPVPA